MTKIQSLLNAAKLADEWERIATLERIRSAQEVYAANRRPKFSLFMTMERDAEKMTRHYARADVSTWNDSAGNSISARVGDYHIVSYWDGEDIIFIYQCGPDDEVSEVIGHDPLFSVEL